MEDGDEEFCNNCRRNVSSNNFALHSAHCERHIFVCSLCDEPVLKSEKKQHLEEYHIVSPCDLCEEPIEKWLLPKHLKLCQRRRVACEYCEAEFPFNELAEHVNFCGSRTEKCLLCKRYIMIKDQNQHNEFHVLELQNRKKQLDDEIKQNHFNEVISKTAEPEKNIAAKLSKTEYEHHKFHEETNSRTVTKKQMETNAIIPEGAVASAANTEKMYSKHYGECPVCKTMIPWIDMNTHVPNCATLNGSCSVCGEKVPGHKLKNHMKDHFNSSSKNITKVVTQKDESYLNRNRFENSENHVVGMDVDESIIKCPLCSQPCTDDRIEDHVETCPKNVYECPLCCETVHESDRPKHEKNGCRMLKDTIDQNISRNSCQRFFDCPVCFEKVPDEEQNSHLSFGCKKLFEFNNTRESSSERDDSSDSYRCPLCLKEMRMSYKNHHESFECEVLIENTVLNEVVLEQPPSYADVMKKEHQCCEKCPCKKKSDICVKCKNTFPSNKFLEHAKNCQRLKKKCDYCQEMMDSNCEEIHKKCCPALKSKRGGRDHKSKADLSFHTLNSKEKGAVPKYTSPQDRIKSEIAKCGFCHTTLNANILKFHEDECVHRLEQCLDCQKFVAIKDYQSHQCKKKRGKTKKADKQTSEEKGQHGWTQKLYRYFSNQSDDKEKDKNDPSVRDLPTGISGYGYNQYDTSDNMKNYSGTWSSNFGYNQYNTPYNNHYLSSVLDEEPLLPCEFCKEKFPASELVQHETGCEPELVSYPKPNSSVSAKLEDSNSVEPTLHSPKPKNMNAVGEKNSFFTGNSSFSSSSKKERLKYQRNSDSTPGEFLQGYDKNISVNNAGVSEKKESKKDLQSLWNIEHAEEAEEDSCANSDSSGNEMDTEQRQPENFKEKNFGNGKENCEKMSSGDDEEMTAMFDFLKDVRCTDYNQKVKSPSIFTSKISKNLEINKLNPHVSVQGRHSKDACVAKETSSNEEAKRMYEETCKSIADLVKIKKEYLSNKEHLEKIKHSSNESTGHVSNNLEQQFVSPENKYDLSKNTQKERASNFAESLTYPENHSSKSRNLSHYGNKSSILTSESSVYHTELPEKRDKESEKLYQRNFFLHTDSNKFHKETTEDENVYRSPTRTENSGEHKKLFSQRSSADDKENESNSRFSKDFKFSQNESLALHCKDDTFSEKLSKYSEKSLKKISSKHIDNDQEDLGKLNYRKDLEHKPYEFSSSAHKCYLQSNVQPQNSISNTEELYKHYKSRQNPEDEKESLRNYRKFQSESCPENFEKLKKEPSTKYIDSHQEDYANMIKHQMDVRSESSSNEYSRLGEKNYEHCLKPHKSENETDNLFKQYSKHNSGEDRLFLRNGKKVLPEKHLENSEKLAKKLSAKNLDKGNKEDMSKLILRMDLKSGRKSSDEDDVTFVVHPAESNFQVEEMYTQISRCNVEDKEDFLYRGRRVLSQKYSENPEIMTKKEGIECFDKSAEEIRKLKLKKELRYSPYESINLSDDNDEHCAVQLKKSSIETDPYKHYTSKCSAEEEKEYLKNFRQHLPDFKFTHNTRLLSSEDKSVQNAETEIKTERSVKRAFKLEPAESSMKKSLYAAICQKDKEREIRDLDQKIAELKNRALAPGTNKDDTVKWKQWREKKSYESSDSE